MGVGCLTVQIASSSVQVFVNTIADCRIDIRQKPLLGCRWMLFWRRLRVEVLRMSQSSECSIKSDLPELSPSDWLVVWLSLGGQNQIRGKTILMKQLFVITREVIPQAIPSFGFYPHRFGPYSSVVEESLNHLSAEGLIEVAEHTENRVENVWSTADPKRYDYFLTSLGRTKAEGIGGKIPADTIQSLVKHKRLLSRMGYYGLLSYVYRTYPEFTSASELELVV